MCIKTPMEGDALAPSPWLHDRGHTTSGKPLGALWTALGQGKAERHTAWGRTAQLVFQYARPQLPSSPRAQRPPQTHILAPPWLNTCTVLDRRPGGAEAPAVGKETAHP